MGLWEIALKTRYLRVRQTEKIRYLTAPFFLEMNYPARLKSMRPDPKSLIIVEAVVADVFR